MSDLGAIGARGGLSSGGAAALSHAIMAFGAIGRDGGASCPGCAAHPAGGVSGLGNVLETVVPLNYVLLSAAGVAAGLGYSYPTQIPGSIVGAISPPANIVGIVAA